jgi:hypothetical protein
MNLNLPNLPPGVVATRLRSTCEEDEFELVGHGDDARILKGGRAAANARVIVEPAKGWSFAFDQKRNCYAPLKDGMVIIDARPLAIEGVVEASTAAESNTAGSTESNVEVKP